MSAEHAAHIDSENYPPDEYYGNASPAKIGMWIFLLSDALMFAGLLLAYGILRGGANVWRCTEELVREGACAAPEPSLGILFTSALTFLLICSSVTMVLAYAAAAEDNRKDLCKYLALTALGGILFLCGQYQEYWGIVSHGLLHEGLHFGGSAYASTFFVVTSFHGMHVFTGVCILLITLFLASRGKFDGGKTNFIEVVGLFWHFVDLIWILVFTFIYLL